MVNIAIKVQSFTDIITNSSSELFCTITAEKQLIDPIYDALDVIFQTYKAYDEIDPCMYHRYRDGEEFIEIEMPYSFENQEVFYRAGICALLDKTFGSDNYNIKFIKDEN